MPFYAKNCLKIANKPLSGELTPFIFNRAQQVLHARIEKHKKKHGKVRAILLKGRQFGGSTYFQGRKFHNLQFNPNKNAFVLAHHAQSTEHIFNMARIFKDNLPGPMKPNMLVDNSREMVFANGSSYRVGTAGSGNIGHGLTVQYLHASELALYERAADITVGLFQAVSSSPGTEFIIESTANGTGNTFHTLWQDAVAGASEFEAIFIPWYWQNEYTSQLREDFALTEEEQEYLRIFAKDGLTPEHLQWRRYKLSELENEKWKFMRMYPFTAEEAFKKTDDSFYEMQRVYLAVDRYATLLDQHVAHLPRILGVDPGRTGDPTVCCDRWGRKVMGFTQWPYQGETHDMVSAGKIARMIQTHDYDAVNIDVGYGTGIIDRLREMGYRGIVHGVTFGSGAIRNDVYRNKRAEMAAESRDWFDEDVAIPDDKIFLAELSALPKEKETSNNLQFIVSKDILREGLKRSTNHMDAFWCTFAFPVKRRPRTVSVHSGITVTNITGQRAQSPKTGLRTLQGVRRGVV